MSKDISAYDKKARRRVIFIVKGNIAISVLTGYTQKYPKNNKKV